MATALTYDSLITDLIAYLERGASSSVDPTVYNQIPRLINNAERHIARILKIQGLVEVVTSTMTRGTCVVAKPDRWRQTVSITVGLPTVTYSTVTRVAAAGTRTLTLDRPHQFAVGDTIVVSNVSGSGYNGTMTVTAVAQLTVTYVNGSTTESATADASGLVSDEMEQRTPVFPRSYEYVSNFWPDRAGVDAPQFYADYDYEHWLLGPTPDQPYPYELVYYQLPALLDDTNQTNWLTEYAPRALLYGALLEMTPFLKDDERINTWQQYFAEAIEALKGEDIAKIVDRSTQRASS